MRLKHHLDGFPDRTGKRWAVGLSGATGDFAVVVATADTRMEASGVADYLAFVNGWDWYPFMHPAGRAKT